MKRTVSWIFMIGLLSIVIVGCSLSPVDVQGVIVDPEGDHLAGLTVSLAGKTVGVNDEGAFQLGDVPGGKQSLIVTRNGKEIHREVVMVHEDHAFLTIHLGQLTSWIPVAGEWTESLEDGVFMMKNSDRETGTTNAYAEVEQSGKKIIYEWSMREHRGGSTGVHILAQSGTDSAHHGGSYLIFHAGSTLRLYRTSATGLEGDKLAASLRKDSVPVHNYRVEVNTVTGVIDIYYNGRFVGGWTDPEPYVSGQFIALRTNRTEATFSNVRVTAEH